MKKIIFFSFLFFFLLTFGCSRSAKENIIGKWKLSKVGTETLSASGTDASIEFINNGKMIIIVDNDSSECKWELSSDEKTVYLINSGNKKKKWNIISLSNNEFVYTEESDSANITLTK